MVEWMKWKYRKPKPTGKYKSTSNDSAKKTKKYSGGSTTVVYSPSEHVLHVDAQTGKRSWKHG